MAVGLATLNLAAAPRFYLPQLGPVWLKFADPRLARAPVPLPELPAPEVHEAHSASGHHVPPANPEPAVPSGFSPMNSPEHASHPLVGPATNSVPVNSSPAPDVLGQPLIGPMMEANNPIAPQMFLRFFRPDGTELSREVIVPVTPNFSPARPPSASSTATYRQTKP